MFVQMETQNNRSVYINMYSTNALKCDGERLQLKKRKKRRSLFFEYQPSLTVCAFLSFQELINLNACVSVGVLRQFCIWKLALIVRLLSMTRIPAQRQKIADDIVPLISQGYIKLK